MSILLLGGSPAAVSSTGRLLDHVAEKLAERSTGHRYTKVQVRELPAHALLHAETSDLAIKRALAAVSEADAVIIATPVYKASYTGLLKAFLDLLPRELEGRKLRHVVEVRHDSFCVPEFITLLRQFNTPLVFSEHATFPAISDVTGDFVYARLQKGEDSITTAYPPKALDAWAKRLETWAAGGEPTDLPRVDDTKAKKAPRDVFAYVIHEAKVRAPAGAMALIERVKT